MLVYMCRSCNGLHIAILDAYHIPLFNMQATIYAGMRADSNFLLDVVIS